MTFQARNRLTNLGVNGTVGGAPGAIAGYTYTLDAAGHRTGVSELSGRTVGYTYDNLYRLTSETIAGDPHAINGAVSYVYDAVGNRKQIVRCWRRFRRDCSTTTPMIALPRATVTTMMGRFLRAAWPMSEPVLSGAEGTSRIT